MANLQETIEQNKKKTQPVTQLAGQVGLPVSPTTAVGTGTIGGTAQQQAMAGTPAQKKSVLEAVTKVARPQGETELEQAKLLRAPAKETASDQASKQKVALLTQSLGTYGTKVTEFIDSALTKITGAPATPPVEGQPTTPPVTTDITPELVLDKLPAGVDKEQVKGLIKDILAETDTTKKNEKLAKLNIAMGKKPGEPLDAAAVTKLFSDAGETVKKQTEEKVRRAAMGEDMKLTISDFTALGTTVDEISGLFGLTPEQVNNLTVNEFQNLLAAQSQTEPGLAAVQATTAGMTEGSLLSTAEREALRGNLAQLEERGLGGAAVQYGSLLEDIDRGTQVSVGGTSYSVEELLASGSFGKIAEQFLSDPNSPWAKQLAASEPELASYLTANRDNLQKLITGAGEATAAFGKLQTATAEQFKGIDPAILKSLTGIDLGQFQTSAIDTASITSPAVQTFLSLPSEKRATFGSNLKLLTEEVGADAVKNYDAKTIAAMDLSNPDGPGAKWMSTVRNLKSSLSSPNRNEVLNAVTDGFDNFDDIDAQLSEDSLREALGLPKSDISKLDTNNDRKLSDEELRSYTKNVSIPDFASFSSGTWKETPQLKAKALTTPEQQLLDAVKDDDKITANELDGLSTDQLRAVTEGVTKPEYKSSIAQILDDRINKELGVAGISPDMLKLLDSPPQTGAGVGDNIYADAARWQDWLQKTSAIKNTLSTLAGQDILSKAAKEKIQRLLQKTSTSGSTLV